ncbi:ObirIr14 [Ooceraea biroi]|uniref:ObirIr14 n=1 Tax=Ooceraea biroi TaxID=2015173 RepID=A0A3L8D832_OOCBI|nr:ObirIr14 [Ooceraea biroi]
MRLPILTDLEITHLVHSCSRLLSQYYIVTVDVHFRKMWRSLRYHHQIVQPVTIVIIPNSNAYLEFVETTKTYPMSFPVWFVLFLFSPANNTHDHCHQPLGNPFNLAFDTQMLVLCLDDDVLREWYSIKGETVKIFDLARWSDEKGFVLLTNLSLYERRNDLEGTVLRTVTVKDIPLSSMYSGNYVANLYGKVLDELTYSLNFTLDIVSEVNGNGLWNRQNNTWSGVMAEIVSGRADFAIADMSMTSLRIRYVDFTLPLIISRNSLFIKEPDMCGVKWFGYLQAFRFHTWFGISMIVVITPLLLSFMKICCESRNIADLLSENFLHVWGIFCQQALIDFPRPSSLRIAYFTIFLTAILISAYYSAALVCFLTACTHVLPFRTIDEFVEDGSYKLIVPRGSADYDIVSSSTKSFSVKLMKLMKEESELPPFLINGFEQICTEKKLAYMVLNALKKSVEMRIPCKLSAISTERIDNLGMVLSKNNPYTSVINYHLQKFLDNGMMMRLKNTRFLPRSVIEGKAYEPVRLISIIPILANLCGGVILSIAVLIIERIHHRQRERKLQAKVFHRSKRQPLAIKR